MDIDTKVIHEGEGKTGPIVLPIYQTANYLHEPETEYSKVKYLRLNNSPNHKLLSKKISSLEGTEDAVVTSSGMSAITTALLSLTELGDIILAQRCLYGGTSQFFKTYIKNLGREVLYFDDEDEIEKLLSSKTKILYLESLSNPTLRIPDFEKIQSIVKKHSLLTVVDNTMVSSYNFRPYEWGFDVIVHSATKYFNGHSDIVGGCVAANQKIIAQVISWLNILGGCMDPHTCFLLNRGLKTYGLRMKAHNENALKLAMALEDMPTIKKVIYPGRPHHPDYERAKKYFKGTSGMVCFEVEGSSELLEQKINKLELPYIAASLGAVETLVTRPCTTSHLALTEEERQKMGISQNLVRISVGAENIDDLILDFKQAFGG